MMNESRLKLVVDTSIIVAALLKKKSLPYEVIIYSSSTFYAPRHLVEEIERHIDDILKKSELTEFQVRTRLSEILNKIILLDEEDFIDKLQEAMYMIGHRDVKDVPFVAVLLSINGDGILSYNRDFDELNAYGFKRYIPRDLYEIQQF